MQAGRYRILNHNHGMFRLDGGAMFGSVPRPLWARAAPPDESNRILLATRSLIVEEGDRKLLVDVGCGDKWDEKSRSIFCLPDVPYAPLPGVTDVCLTHLHFDHAGGVSRRKQGNLLPNYPDAIHHVPAENLANAKAPNVRERASYLEENYSVLDHVRLNEVRDGDSIWPGITVHRSDGHTRGLHWVRVESGGVTLAFPTDLIPTSAHLPIPYAMGYDICAETSMREKSDFLKAAVHGGWIVVFEHDPSLAAAKLQFDDRGRAVISETFEF